MEVKIEEVELDFIFRNIQNTLNLLNYSKVINHEPNKYLKIHFIKFI